MKERGSSLISPDSWRAQGKYLPSGVHRLFYRRAGSGAALLLLHGFPTSSWDFQAVWADLCARHDVLAPDYVGFGFSDKPRAARYSVFGYADQVEALLTAQGIREYHVLAHDLGDTVAQELLARARESRGGPRVLSAFFLNGGLFPEQHRPRLIQTLLASAIGPLVARLSTQKLFARSFSQVFGPRTKPSEDELAGYWTCVSHAQGTRIQHRLIDYMRERREQRERWVPALSESPVPIGFCIGLADPVSGEHVVPRIRELCPGARVSELPEIGHYPQAEAPAAVLSAYEEFRRSLMKTQQASRP
jgi:pimeloyl-ACP methyl ester carboxylesterase